MGGTLSFQYYPPQQTSARYKVVGLIRIIVGLIGVAFMILTGYTIVSAVIVNEPSTSNFPTSPNWAGLLGNVTTFATNSFDMLMLVVFLGAAAAVIGAIFSGKTGSLSE